MVQPGNTGFHWSEVDKKWDKWDNYQFRTSLNHPIAQSGFDLDFNALREADATVLLLPCGRSAHLEAGFAVGQGKPLYIMLTGKEEPELLYKLAKAICVTTYELRDELKKYQEILESSIR